MRDVNAAAVQAGGSTCQPESASGSGIEVVNLCKTYKGGRVKAIDGLSLTVRPGEALGLVGPNGAGKTTLLGCLMGFLNYQSGTISIDGLAVDDLVTRSNVGYLPERLTFDRWMTGRDFLHYHHELSGRPHKLQEAETEELLRRVDLEPSAWSKPVRKYSRGMLQRLGFAQALIGKPRYLLLDEPASGMDPHGVLVVQELLQSLRAEGLTFLLNSHQLDQIERSCDRVAFIQKGKVIKEENLRNRESSLSHTLIVKWLLDGAPVEASTFTRVTAHCGATLEQFSPEDGLARVFVDNEEDSASLIKGLVEAGVPVTRVLPELSRLQRVFIDEMRRGEKQ
ncbi:MAG TPA: ABC transporter ATP-binding protein [Candidatus Obscuribacter sp.]|nr:ABC transporter ATP-binding protein [Candidatus Obscuribacter sp.]HNM48360.1 ABC transporter ATP-binding protein [Candidatus Obscuribacter sp.]